jgi:hypothetical protein
MIMPYLDPGTGSLLIQIIIGGALGVGLALSVFWKKIKRLFSKNKLEDNEIFDPTDISADIDES